MKVIGFEAANSYVKIKSNTDEEAYPNVLWRVTDDYQTDIMSNRKLQKIYQVGSESYVPGLRWKGYTSSSGPSAERYKLPQYKNESLIALARHNPDGEDLSVVTAVPAIHYENDQIKKDIEKALKDVHAIKVNGNSIIFTVKKVQTILQPVAMVISAALNVDGSTRTASMTKNSKIVIDIGWGTTDVAIMQGMDLIKPFHVDVAMLNAYERINAAIRREFPTLRSEPFKLFDLEMQLRTLDSFEWGNRTYDVADIKERAFQATANEILAEITNRTQLSQYDLTLFGGGGIEALKKYFKPQLEGVNAQQVTNPQMANAIGCYIFGTFKK